MSSRPAVRPSFIPQGRCRPSLEAARPEIPARPLTDKDGFQKWFAGAKPGESLIYHRGHLAADRNQPFRSQIASLAELARSLAERGQVLLVQKRRHEGVCDYLAVKAATPRPLSPFGPWRSA